MRYETITDEDVARETDTPRTDALCRSRDRAKPVTDLELDLSGLARELERELSRVGNDCETIRRAAHKAEQEVESLTDERDALRDNWHSVMRTEAKVREELRTVRAERAALRAALETISAMPINATLTAVDMQNVANRALAKVQP